MNDMPCTKQVRSPALRSHGDLIWLMAEARQEFIPTCQQTFPVAQTVKYLPTMQETQVPSLDQEDPLEKEMATHSSILAWKIPWTEEPGRLQSMGSPRDWRDFTFFLSLHSIWNLNSLTRNRTCAPCNGSTESLQLGHPEIPVPKYISSYSSHIYF